MPADAVVVGRVEDAWGVRGALRIAPFGDASDTVLTISRRWWLRRPNDERGMPRSAAKPSTPKSQHGADPLATGARLFDVDGARRHSGAIVARFQGVGDRDAAQALKGAEVLVSRADFPPLPADEYYWVDLVGCTVDNPAGQALGVVTAIDDHGAHPILHVRAHDTGSDERLIPFVPAYIVEVNVGARRIVADWGLDY